VPSTYPSKKHTNIKTTFNMSKNLLLTAAAFLAAALSYATEPTNYYSTCEGKNGATLLSALCAKVGPHTEVGYSGLWTLYQTSDVKSNGKIWDMYSTKEWTYKTEQCGNYSGIGDCYNREHSMPKSWFDDATPMYDDAFHIYPTDGKVNAQRSNYPYGECANGTSVASRNGVDALGKLGACTFSGYTGTVFEPDDEYKGDFARSYFYMAAAYNDKIETWTSDMLAKNAYPAFTDWAVNLLLKWHRQDPVSQKELDRQEAVYAKQGNRNPFIDHPELAEYIWGDKQDEAWSAAVSSEPSISLPLDGSTVSLGAVGVGVARTFNITVKGSNLSQNVSVAVSGNGFAVSPSTVSASAANAVDGTSVAVTLTAAAAGAQTGTLAVSSGDVSSTVTLTATAYDGLPASEPTNISSDSFIAHWTYVGNADSNGRYKLVLTYADGEEVDTYPRDVVAANEQCVVDELDPETEYVYYITNGVLTSNKINVTTGALMPNIELEYDGELFLTAAPGEPSEAEEILVVAENITDDITLTVKEPFQLSSDKADWATTLTIKADEDRFYIRINGETNGTYSSEIVATSGSYSTDEAVVSGKIADTVAFFEDFEKENNGTSYNDGSVNGTATAWTLSNAGVVSDASVAYGGSNYLRFGNTSSSFAAMAADKANGIGTVSLYVAGWSAKDGAATISLQYSTDGGETWITAGTADIPAPSDAGEYKQYTFTVNQTGNARIKILQTAGKRLCIDNVTITDYKGAAGIDGVTSDYKSWDAYCHNGVLCIELTSAAHVKVYGMDGIAYHNGTLDAGTTTLALNPGLYIVVVDDFTRRVLVK
jgi:endonuclease I